MPAFGHLVRAADSEVAPELTVHLWESATSGVPIIRAPRNLRVLEPGGVIPGENAQGLHGTYRPENELLAVLDRDRGCGVMWIREVAKLPRYERAAPLRSMLAAFFDARGKVMTHAGSVAWDGHGVLMGGSGGSGKSSTALTCLQAGFDYAGDDFVLTEPNAEPHPWVHSLFATGKVFPTDTGHFAGIAPAFVADADNVTTPMDDKATAFLHGPARAQLSGGFPLVAVLMPVVTGALDTHAAPLSSGRALLGLAPSTVFMHDGRRRAMLSALARLVERLPCYRLSLGTERTQIPEVVAGVIAQCLRTSERVGVGGAG
jgi:hypothetical protein